MTRMPPPTLKCIPQLLHRGKERNGYVKFTWQEGSHHWCIQPRRTNWTALSCPNQLKTIVNVVANIVSVLAS